jgi:hypothetical protein
LPGAILIYICRVFVHQTQQTELETLKKMENKQDATNRAFPKKEQARTLQQWRDNLKNEHSNPTEVYLDELFDNYINMQ